MTNPDDAATSPTMVLPLAEAASRLGLHPAALRSRVRRGAATARRGNNGRLLVEVTADAPVRHDLATTSPDEELAAEVADLLAELAGLREKLARAEAGLDAAATVAEARISAAKVETKAVRELADRLTQELAVLRRPWWRRWWG